MAKQAPRKKSPARKRAASGAGRRGAKRSRRLSGRVLLAAVAAVIVLAVALVVDSVRVASASMADTLLFGDRLLVDTVALRLGAPQPGDVVALEPPDETDGRRVVKRCVAVAGQRVEIVDKAVFVDGERYPDPPFSKYLDAHLLPAERGSRDNLPVRTVPAGHVFVLGDNRDHSRDSRHYGSVPVERLRGLVRLIWYSDGGDGLRWSRLGSWVE